MNRKAATQALTQLFSQLFVSFGGRGGGNPVKERGRDAKICRQWDLRWKCVKVIFASEQQALVIKIYYFIVLINTNDRAHLLNAFHHHLIHLLLLAHKYYHYLQFSR